jgi:hypothetical protein
MFARTERRRQSAARHIQSVFRRSRAAKRCKLLVAERAAAVTQVAEAMTTRPVAASTAITDQVAWAARGSANESATSAAAHRNVVPKRRST